MGKQPLGIYVHIPFCVKKCAYCDFLSGPVTKDRKADYIEALKKEIRCDKNLKKQYQVVSIFFGGGTPSSLEGNQIEEILDAIYESFEIDKSKLLDGKEDIEITVEANPGTLSKEKLRTYRLAGVNRLSIGLQSANDTELKLLGRIHTYEEFLHNYQLAREAGFMNINVDLMSALPGQTLESYEDTLRKVVVLRPTHISAYSLIIEEGTPFYEKYGEGMPEENLLPTEEVDRLMYARTKEILKGDGYERYEISNYAKKGYACRHNSLYWNGTDYIGFGLGASSYLRPVRYQNETDMDRYLSYLDGGIDASTMQEKLHQNRTELTKENQMEEFMFLGLRLTKGVSLEEFEIRFGISIKEVYENVISKHSNEGLLEITSDAGKQYLALTEKGRDVSNYVMADFLLDE